VDSQVPDEDPNATACQEETVGNVTDRHQSEEVLNFFASVRHGIFIGAVGRAAFANPCLKGMLGISPDALHQHADPFDVERFTDQSARDAFLSKLSADGYVDNQLLQLRRNDGSLIWVEVSATNEGAIIRDVSDRKRREEQSRDVHHQLAQSEKLAALGQTISGVAHELNNPLATILSWAERLAESPSDDKTRRGLDVILKESERAARIVRNLLTFARKRQSTRMMVDVNEVVRETLQLRAYEQRVHNISVTPMLKPDLPQVFADGHQVKQILLNLMINAEQAMLTAHGRGTLVVRTWHDADADSIVIEVNDDGPGISTETQSRVFDPFFTTKEVGKGTGLGLSVAYAIAQEHGGRMWVSSSPGAGASFFVELPVAGDDRQISQATQPPIALEAFTGRRVLVVEDEPALGAAVAEALSDAGLVVERASDGEEGLTRLSEGTYDLIVCDLKMPRIDGMQFYRAMAVAAPALRRRVIFVTGAVAGTEAERFLEETGCRWLAKPFRLGDLLRAAREALT
jgi:two-component system cell cycle sensor histidine kinase/response regulator CckA